MSVYRTKPLPTLPARGRLVVSAAAMDATMLALRSTVGGDGERHEGLVYWTGRIVGQDTYVLAAVVPDAEHSPQRVVANASAMGTVARTARTYRLGVVAQVHSHPGNDTRHSDGDDDLVFMPFEGMFSIVIGSYGDAELDGLGLHQFQDGQWVAVTREALVLVPSALELRDE